MFQFTCRKNSGCPLVMYAQFFQPHILAVPIADVQDYQITTTNTLSQTCKAACFNDITIQIKKPHNPASTSYIPAYQHDVSSQSYHQPQPAVRITHGTEIPIETKHVTEKRDDTNQRCHKTPTKADQRHEPLGETPRRQTRRRMLIITKTRKINFDLPEDSD